MSKAKRAKFRLRAEETVIKRGMMDYLPTGRYAHFVPGDAVLTDARFYFEAGLAAGEAYIVEIPLAGIYAVEKIGVPFLTRSLRILTDRGDHRFNALFVGRWYKALRRAISAARVEKNVS